MKQAAVPGLLAIRLYRTDTLNNANKAPAAIRNTPAVMRTVRILANYLDAVNDQAFRTDRFKVDRSAAYGEDENTQDTWHRNGNVFPGISFPWLGELVHELNLFHFQPSIEYHCLVG